MTPIESLFSDSHVLNVAHQIKVCTVIDYVHTFMEKNSTVGFLNSWYNSEENRQYKTHGARHHSIKENRFSLDEQTLWSRTTYYPS